MTNYCDVFDNFDDFVNFDADFGPKIILYFSSPLKTAKNLGLQKPCYLCFCKSFHFIDEL